MNTTIGVQTPNVGVPTPKVAGISPRNHPEKKFRAGGISATVWLNKGKKTNGEESEYRTISIERNYTDKEGKWQSTNSLRLNDLPKAVVALQKAYEHLVLHEQDLKGGF
ncbi:hypothetical protein HYX14_02495 [Candidatus Woesearchaeota archaeon]|nr:hypothetical protein [Candidatus Woesearchaeota archaeon]